MGDWSILGRFLSEVQNHSTVIGKIWLTMLLIFRILLVALVGDAVYSDEQSKFTCNTQQPGCNNVCYDTFAPVSHLRFWVFQIVVVSTPSIFYIVFVLHKITKDEKLGGERSQVFSQGPSRTRPGAMNTEKAEPPRMDMAPPCPWYREDWESKERGEVQSQPGDDYRQVGEDPTYQSNQILLIYILHVLLRSVMELTFLMGQYFLFGFEVPHLYHCETYPCPTRTDCFVSRATEKSIFMNFMFSISLCCFLLNIIELHYLGWVYIFRVLCSACSTCCCGQDRNTVKLLPRHDPLLLQHRHSQRGQLVLQSPATRVPEKLDHLLTHIPSFGTNPTMECSFQESPDSKIKVEVKQANMACWEWRKKSWL